MELTLRLKDSNNCEGITMYPPFVDNELIENLIELGLNEDDVDENYIEDNYKKTFEFVDWDVLCEEIEEELKEEGSIYELMESLEELDRLEYNREIDHVLAYKEVSGCNISEAISNCEDYSTFYGWSSPRDMAEDYLAMEGIPDNYLMTCILNNMDYEDFIKEYADVIKTDYGYISCY